MPTPSENRPTPSFTEEELLEGELAILRQRQADPFGRLRQDSERNRQAFQDRMNGWPDAR